MLQFDFTRLSDKLIQKIIYSMSLFDSSDTIEQRTLTLTVLRPWSINRICDDDGIVAWVRKSVVSIKKNLANKYVICLFTQNLAASSLLTQVMGLTHVALLPFVILKKNTSTIVATSISGCT